MIDRANLRVIGIKGTRSPVDEDLLDPADLVERPGERVLLRLRMDAPVRRIR